MIDAEDLLLGEHRQDAGVELPWASASVVPNGFSMITRTSAPSRRFSPCSPSFSTINGKNIGAVER